VVCLEANACLGCRFSSVKVDISVPEKYDLKKFTKETKKFASNMGAMASQKRIHYALVFDSERQKTSNLDFTVNCSCILNVKKVDCSKFSSGQNCKIKHLHYSKPSTIEVAQRIC
jgi:hypothetical protein